MRFEFLTKIVFDLNIVLNYSGFVLQGALIRTDQKYEWPVYFFYFVASSIFPQKFVASPNFRINIYGVYFVKIEKMLASPKNHQKKCPLLQKMISSLSSGQSL